MSARTIFITATDTHAGKTVATRVLAELHRARGRRVGVMKPVQCAGNDAAVLKRTLGIGDDMTLINPCYAPEPLSPHLAFRRAGKRVDLAKIRAAHEVLCGRYDVLLVEGAGGLMVPLKKDYYMADLARDLGAEIIIVSRLGLGTINHTLLTINQARAYGLSITGILFSDATGRRKTAAEKTNPAEIRRLSGYPVLGTIPHLRTQSTPEILAKCRRLKTA